MKREFLLGLMVCLSLSGFIGLVIACPVICPDCYSGDECDVYDCNSADCESCVDGSCEECGGDPNQFCCDGNCCDTDECEECIDGNCVVIDVNSVTVDANAVCVGCDVAFTVITDPCGYGDDVEWTCDGDPNSGTGSSFTTSWDTAGIHTATASLCDSNDSNDVTVVAVASLEPNDPNEIYTEFDDEDGDPNTRSFVVCIVDPNHDPNVITVIATPEPDVNEADLPDSWSFTGGTDVNDEFVRTVDRTVTGVTTLTCTCGDSSKITKIYVVKVELGFKNSKMGTPKKIDPLDPPVNVRIGVILADSITLNAILTPDVTLGNSEYSWTGEKAGTGPTISVKFDILGNSRTESLTVLGVTRTATTTVIFVPAPTRATWAAIYGAEARQWALDNTVALGGGYSNGRADAARHAYWNVLMTIEMSASIAATAATSYEKTCLDGGAPHNATVMDMENNKHGRTIAGGLGADPNRTDCQNAVIDALNDGTLTILDDVNNPSEKGLLIPSDE